MFYALLIIICISTSLLYAASFSDGYRWEQGLFYMQQSHAVASIGGSLCVMFVVIGFIGFFVGLIFPKIVYFSKSTSRLKATSFYACIFLLGIVLRMESQYLLIGVGHREIKTTIELSNAIKEEMPVVDLLHTARKYGIGPQYTRLGWYYDKIPHDRADDNLPTIEFSFPSFESYLKL